jgi:hydroxyethylthiazole kinase-like sugar kinase family protein
VVPVVKGNPGEIILVVEEELKVRQVSVDAQRELGYTVIQAAKPAQL